MAIGRPIPPLELSAEEREALERWVRRPTSAQALALRARIVLNCAEGRTNTAVAAELGLAKPTVGKWRAPRPVGAGSMGCWMSRGRERPGRLPMRTWSGC